MKGPATGENGACHGPLCMNAPTSRPVFPAPAIILPPVTFSLPWLACSPPVGMFVFVCVPLSLFITSVVTHLTFQTSSLQIYPYNFKLLYCKLGMKTVSR